MTHRLRTSPLADLRALRHLLPRRRREVIDVRFARALASHIAVGLARNAEPDEQQAAERAQLSGEAAWALEMQDVADRARGALHVLALSLANATDDEQVHHTLHQRLTAHRDGGTVVLRGEPQPIRDPRE